MPSVEAMLVQKQLRWVGHIVRMPNHRYPKLTLYGELDGGKRRLGRPKLRYRDVTKRHLQAVDINCEDLERLAGDREQWKLTTKQAVNAVEERRKREYEERKERKANPPPPTRHCQRCGRGFINAAGLSAHTRLSRVCNATPS